MRPGDYKCAYRCCASKSQAESCASGLTTPYNAERISAKTELAELRAGVGGAEGNKGLLLREVVSLDIPAGLLGESADRETVLSSGKISRLGGIGGWVDR